MRRGAGLAWAALALASCLPGELTLADSASANVDGGGGGGGSTSSGSGGAPGTSPDGGPGPGEAGVDAPTCTMCGPACLELATDPKNCGACGHDCLGGACQAGACQPLVIASNQGAWAIAVDATTAYYTKNLSPGGGVFSVPITGGTPATFASAPSTVVSIALHGGNLFYPSSRYLYQCPVGASCPSPQVIAGTNSLPWKLVTDGSHVYWRESSTPLLMRAPVGGTSGSTFALSSAADFALSGGTLYWTVGGQPGQLLSCPTSSACGSPVVLEDNLAAPGALAISTDGQTAYWAEKTELRRCALAGCASGKFATLPYQPVEIAVDDTHAYFLNSGSIGRCALAACNPVELRRATTTVRSFTLDAVSIYWTEGGSVFRLAK